MVNNQKGAVIPYQPTYSIQYKYGNRYGPQSFSSPTTSLGTAGQAGGPLSGQTTLDQTALTEETAAPTTVDQSGDGQTLDSGAPGGTGGADFSQLEGYSPVQPDLGWLYADSYGNNPFVPPPTSGFGYDTNTTSSTTNSIIPVVTEGGESSPTTNDAISGRSMGDDKFSIFGFEFGNPSAPDAGDGGGPTGDPDDDDSGNVDTGMGIGSGVAGSSLGIGPGMGELSSDDNDTENNDNSNNSSPSGNENQGVDGGGGAGADNSSGAGVESGVSDFNTGGLVPAFGMKKRNKDIPNPLLEDPLADLFRRA